MFSLFLLLLAIGLDFVHIWIQKVSIDYVVTGQFSKMPLIVFYFVVVVMSMRLLNMAADLILNLNIAKLDDRLTRDMYDSVHRLPIADYQNERIAKYVTNITNDVREAGMLIAFQIPKGIAQMVNVLAFIVVVGISSFVLLSIVLVMASIYILLGKRFNPLVKTAAKEVAEKRTELLVNTEESISSTREVISFNRLRWEKNQYLLLFNNYYRKVMNEGKLENKRMLLSEPLHWGTNLGVLGYGGYRVVTGHMSIGLFTVLYQMAAQLMGGISGVYNFFANLSRSAAYLDRIMTVLEGARIDEGQRPLDGKLHSLQMDGVRFRYEPNQEEVLKGISLDIPLGSKIAFVGSSGGGKSTISQLLTRFFEPTDGGILVNGIHLNEIKSTDWTKRVTTVFQDPYLFSDTIRSNLLMGREEISEAQMIRACIAVNIHDYIVGLPEKYDTAIGERGLTLSGGQRQRIALARALLSDSDILVLDEATSSLDMTTERLVQENIDAWRKNLTTIVIAHRLSTIRNADIVYVLDQGTIAEVGSYVQLLERRGVFSRLVQGQLSS